MLVSAGTCLALPGPRCGPCRLRHFFLQHQGLFSLDALSQLHQGLSEDTGVSTALHTQLSGGFFKVLAGPLCLDQPWTHIFSGVPSPPPGTPEKSRLYTWISHSKEGYFCHHSSCWLCRESNSCTYISTYSVEQRVPCFQGTQHLFSPCSL